MRPIVPLVLLSLLLSGLVTEGGAQSTTPRPVVEAGLGKGITVRSADDKASLNIRARIQVRFTALGQSNDQRDETTEFGIRRMRLVFQGNADGPRLTYYVQLAFSNLDNEADLRLPLRDSYITWTPKRDLNVRVGQMKVPFSRQRVTSSSALAMVDRSIVVSELNLDRDVGVQLFSKDLFGTGKLGYAIALFGGEGRNRLGRTAGMLYTGRLEAWPLGAFDDYVEGDITRGRTLRVAFGVNIGYNQNTNRPRSTIGTPYAAGDFDYRNVSVDAVLKWRGLSLTSEWMARRADRDSRRVTVNASPVTIWSRSGSGFYVQAGQMLTARLEATGRYSRLRRANGTDPAFTNGREAGAGLGYYLQGHDLKLQGDYFHVTDATTGNLTHQARVQLQLFF
mgnify:CR=1 FL=1